LLPRDYFVPGDSAIERELCFGIKSFGRFILGGVMFWNYDVAIDRDLGTVSFTRSNCGNLINYSKLYPEDFPNGDKEYNDNFVSNV